MIKQMAPVLRFHARRAAAWLLSQEWFVASLPFRRYVAGRMRRKIDRVERGLAPPRQLSLETTSICNARCVMCPYPGMKREKTFMDMDLYMKGLRDAVELGIRWVQPQFFGEPLVDRTLEEKIRAAKSLGLYLSLFTNGSLLTADKARMLIKSGVDELKLSIDSHRPEVYESIRRGLKFQKVLENVSGLMALKRQLRSSRPEVWVMMVDFDANHRQVEQYHRFWSRRVDRVHISRSHSWGGRVAVNGLSLHQDPQDRFPCPSPWDQLVVNAQGEILPCCCDYEGTSLSLGNLRDMTLRQAWEGPQMARLRRMHLERRFSELPLCDTCRPNDLW
jgi:radical SAM protein with 4Fe4S-binding SPASM domain